LRQEIIPKGSACGLQSRRGGTPHSGSWEIHGAQDAPPTKREKESRQKISDAFAQKSTAIVASLSARQDSKGNGRKGRGVYTFPLAGGNRAQGVRRSVSPIEPCSWGAQSNKSKVLCYKNCRKVAAAKSFGHKDSKKTKPKSMCGPLCCQERHS